MIQVAKCIKIN